MGGMEEGGVGDSEKGGKEERKTYLTTTHQEHSFALDLPCDHQTSARLDLGEVVWVCSSGRHCVCCFRIVAPALGVVRQFVMVSPQGKKKRKRIKLLKETLLRGRRKV